MKILEILQGYKTYLTIGLVFLILFGVWNHWWTVPNEIYMALFGLALVFLRNGVKNDLSNAESPKANVQSLMGLMGLAVLGLFVFSGCAYMRSKTDRSLDPSNGVVTETTTVRCYTLFDSQSALAKFRNTTGAVGSNGFVFPSGTTIGSLNQESSSTNMWTGIGEVAGTAAATALKVYTGK